MAEALHFGPCFHQHILRHRQADEAAVRTLGTAYRALVAMGHDHQQIHIAVRIRLSPCLGTKEPYFFRRKLRTEPAARVFQDRWKENCHGINVKAVPAM